MTHCAQQYRTSENWQAPSKRNKKHQEATLVYRTMVELFLISIKADVGPQSEQAKTIFKQLVSALADVNRKQ